MTRFFSRKNMIELGRLTLLIFVCYNILWIPVMIVMIRDDSYSLDIALKSSVIDLFISALISFFNIVLLALFNSRIAFSDLTNKKIGIVIAGIGIFNMAVCFPLTILKWWLFTKIFMDCPWDMNENYIDTYVMSSLTSIIVIGYMLIWVVSSLRQKEKFLAEAKIKAIKNQINPHFLFNNLNAGISLIDYDPDKAIDFFTSMARVFRTVLDRSMESVQPLGKELDDLGQYLKLIHIRFGDAIKIDYWLSDDDKRKMIVSGTLQLVFENIVKHNRFSVEDPIKVIIQTKGDMLEISNDYRPLSEEPHSHGIGQSVIIRRYEDFGRYNISFHCDGDRYISQLPLFNTK